MLLATFLIRFQRNILERKLDGEVMEFVTISLIAISNHKTANRKLFIVDLYTCARIFPPTHSHYKNARGNKRSIQTKANNNCLS